MPDIVLATQNARYIHTSLGLRSLLANLGPLSRRAVLREFTVRENPQNVAEALLAEKPQILCLGVYIWNATPTLQLVRLLRQIRPEITIVLGGPEVSHETTHQEIVDLADVVITGEAEQVLPVVLGTLLGGERPADKIIAADPPSLDSLLLAQDTYTEEDILHRLIYVETSRGCPFHCAFCLSALDRRVRRFPWSRVQTSLEHLIARGVRHFKFVDRSLHLSHAEPMLTFFLEHPEPGLFLHFELTPDLLPARLLSLVGRFPPGRLQLEVGVQSLIPEELAALGRRSDPQRVCEVLQKLRQETHAHLHADLVIGLPGQTLQSLATSFDDLLAADPQEIQVGLLKRLRGTPLTENQSSWQLIFDPQPPYEILQTPHLDFETLQRLKRLAVLWDRVKNSGNFRDTAPLLWAGGSPFHGFLRFADHVSRAVGRTHAISLKRLTDLVFTYLVEHRGLDPAEVGPLLLRDYRRGGHRDRPRQLRSFPEPPPAPEPGPGGPRTARRQSRHQRDSD